jgi:hypothetical protein
LSLSRSDIGALTGCRLQTLKVVIGGRQHEAPGEWILDSATVRGEEHLVAAPHEDSGAHGLFIVGVTILVAVSGGAVAAAAVGESVLTEMAKASITGLITGVGTLAAEELWKRLPSNVQRPDVDVGYVILRIGSPSLDDDRNVKLRRHIARG